MPFISEQEYDYLKSLERWSQYGKMVVEIDGRKYLNVHGVSDSLINEENKAKKFTLYFMANNVHSVIKLDIRDFLFSVRRNCNCFVDILTSSKISKKFINRKGTKVHCKISVIYPEKQKIIFDRDVFVGNAYFKQDLFHDEFSIDFTVDKPKL